jgi:hypothetical protein
MERYEAWMKEWGTYKFNWIDSTETVDSFVINAIPPDNKYSTMLHFELALEIERWFGCKTRINQKERRIEMHDGSHLRPSVCFHDKKACSRYPWAVEYGMRVGPMTATTDPIDVVSGFGFVSFRLDDFRRVCVLKIVLLLKSMGFGVLHGVVSSKTDSVGEPSRSHLSKIPRNDDPIWKYVL